MLMNYLKLLRDLQEYAKNANVPGKLEQAAAVLEKGSEALRELAKSVTKYMGPQTVGAAPGVPDEDLVAIEAELSTIARDASQVNAVPGLLVLAPMIIQFAEFGLQLIQQIQERRRNAPPSPAK